MSVNRPARSDTKTDDHSLVAVHSEQAIDTDFSSTIEDSVKYIEADGGKNVIKNLKSPSYSFEGC